MAINNPSFGAAIAATVPVGSGKFTATGTLNHSITSNYPVGSSAGQVDTVYTKGRTVPSSTSPDTVILSSLTDPAGNAIAFGHVVDMIVENTDPTNTLTVGGGSSAVAWLPSTGVAVPPASAIILHVPAGQAVTAGSADHLQVAASGGTNVAYNITIAGRSL
jgi:ATP-dependent protease ClpP protease subunit